MRGVACPGKGEGGMQYIDTILIVYNVYRNLLQRNNYVGSPNNFIDAPTLYLWLHPCVVVVEKVDRL